MFQDNINTQKRLKDLYVVNMAESPEAFTVGSKERRKRNAIFLGLEWEVLIKGHDQDDGVALYSYWNGKPNKIGKFVLDALDKPLGKYVNFRADAGGIELVTIPATLEGHKRWMGEHLFPANITKRIQRHDPEQEVGIHIHVSKKAFNRKSLIRFIAFLRAEENAVFNTELAGRDLYFSKDSYMDPQLVTRDQIRVDRKLRDRNRPGKYEIVNTHSSKGTVEIRIFNSVSTKREVYARLEFIDALVRYTRKENSLTAKDFACFVKNNRVRYPNLMRESSIKRVLKVS